MSSTVRERTARWVQTLLTCVALAFISFFTRTGPSASAASSAEPFDPLVRLEEQVGAWLWGASLEYRPDVHTGTGVDTSAPENVLPVYDYERLSHRMRSCLFATYRVVPRLSLSPAFCYELQAEREARTYYDFSTLQPFRQVREQTLASAQGSLEILHRLNPAHTLDPRFSLGVSYPWRLSVGLSGSFLRDPVVISANLGYSMQLEGHEQSASLQLGAGFVTNEHFSFSLVSGLVFPVARFAAPAPRVSLRLLYTPQAGEMTQLSVESFLSAREGVPQLGVAVGWQSQLHMKPAPRPGNSSR